VQLQEQMPVRGYLSSVDRTLIFGLGEATPADSLVIVWPNDKKQTLAGMQTDMRVICNQKEATASFYAATPPTSTLFTDITG
jgi:hypothetical protein